MRPIFKKFDDQMRGRRERLDYHYFQKINVDITVGFSRYLRWAHNMRNWRLLLGEELR